MRRSLVIVTGKPELAVGATVKLLPYIELAGGVAKVMVWLSLTAVVVRTADPVTDPTVAFNVAVPPKTPVARPAVTFAEALLELQVADEVRSFCEPSL